jgi:hypothetical protein
MDGGERTRVIDGEVSMCRLMLQRSVPPSDPESRLPRGGFMFALIHDLIPPPLTTVKHKGDPKT